MTDDTSGINSSGVGLSSPGLGRLAAQLLTTPTDAGGGAAGLAPPGSYMMDLGQGLQAIPALGPSGERLTPSQALLQYHQQQAAKAGLKLTPVEHNPFEQTAQAPSGTAPTAAPGTPTGGVSP